MRERSKDRLFRLLPGHHQALDMPKGRPLEALMRLLAEELEIVEGDIDRLYDNWFIETCEPWVISYIGELIGARTLRPFGEASGGLRPHVANTLAYRQSKGAAAALEQMARDVTGWPAIAVEFFERLVWSQNLNHIRPAALGSASLRDAEGARMTGTTFETVTHTAAAGPVAGPSGRYNIPSFGIFVWRLQAFALGFLSDEKTGYLGGPVPSVSAFGPGFRRFDPLGADRPLLNRSRADVDLAARATARNVPGRLDRRTLFRDLEALRAGTPNGGNWFRDPSTLQIRLGTETLPPEKLHACNLEDRDDGAGGTTWRRPATAGEVFFDPELGRLSLHPDDQAKTVETVHAYGASFELGAGPQDRRASVEEWRTLLFPTGASDPWRIGVSSRAEEVTGAPEQGGPVVATLAEAIERWNAAAVSGLRGIITVMDSATYADDLATDVRIIAVPDGARLAIVAAGWPLRDLGGGARMREPTQLSPINRRPHVRSDLRIRGTGADSPGTLILDGLLIEGGIHIEDGELGELQLRHATVGAAAVSLTGGMRVLAGNERLRLMTDHAILGRAEMGAAGGGVALCDSILGEDRTADTTPTAAFLLLDAPKADLEIARSTLFGRVRGRTLEAENAIFQGLVEIARRQEGCVRFCFVPEGSRTPMCYRCAPDLSLADERAKLGRHLTSAERALIVARVAPQFASAAFNTESFGALALTCPTEIAEGAEDGAAMGAGFRHGEPARRANLRDALEEYLPFGLEAGVIFAT
jgi:hypothetical protein